MPSNDRKPLVLSTYHDAQQHLPYADDSNAVTPMSEENGAIIVPVYYCNLGIYCFIRNNNKHFFIYSIKFIIYMVNEGSRHSSYTSHQSRISYTSHGDLLGGIPALGGANTMTKESKLRNRNTRNQSFGASNGTSYVESTHKEHPQREYVNNQIIYYFIFIYIYT